LSEVYCSKLTTFMKLSFKSHRQIYLSHIQTVQLNMQKVLCSQKLKASDLREPQNIT